MPPKAGHSALVKWGNIMSTSVDLNSITSQLVSEDNRFDFLPKLFGENLMIIGENTVYAWMSRLSVDYKGGYWEYYQLSNDGLYMAPRASADMLVVIPGNYFMERVSPGAAGVIACLFALNNLFCKFPNDYLADAYQNLRDYVCFHPESNMIYRAID